MKFRIASSLVMKLIFSGEKLQQSWLVNEEEVAESAAEQ